MTIPPTDTEPGEPLPGAEEDDETVFTSARKVSARPGAESAYLDKIASRVIKTALVNIRGLDPFQAAKVARAVTASRRGALIDSLIADMRRNGEIEAEVELEPLKGRIARELLDLGPLTELMQDDDVVEIQVVGGGLDPRGPRSTRATSTRARAGPAPLFRRSGL